MEVVDDAGRDIFVFQSLIGRLKTVFVGHGVDGDGFWCFNPS